jgi:hypothetical protein
VQILNIQNALYRTMYKDCVFFYQMEIQDGHHLCISKNVFETVLSFLFTLHTLTYVIITHWNSFPLCTKRFAYISFCYVKKQLENMDFKSVLFLLCRKLRKETIKKNLISMKEIKQCNNNNSKSILPPPPPQFIVYSQVFFLHNRNWCMQIF